MKDKIVEIYNKHIKEKPYLKNDNVLLFIEGLGNYKGKAIKDITLHPKGRMGAIFAIITKDGELFYTTSASTLPDIPMGEGKYNDDTPTPTLELGVYNVYSKLHKGKYAMELGLGNESVPVIRRSGYPGSTGIDIHSRPIDDYKNAACFAGCLTISKSQFTRMLEILGVTNKGKFIGGGHYIGKVIIDRSYITEDLQKLYKNEHIEIKSESLSTVNEAAEILTNVIDEANLSPGIKALTLKTLYKEKANLLLPIEIKSEKQYFDTTQIAKRLGVMSKSGKPATTAISQLIKQLDISEDEKEAFFEGKGKWQGTVYKYADSVIKKVENWLKENNYPALIRGNSQNYHVQYALEVA